MDGYLRSLTRGIFICRVADPEKKFTSQSKVYDAALTTNKSQNAPLGTRSTTTLHDLAGSTQVWEGAIQDHVAEAGASVGGQYARSIARSVSGVVDGAARRCILITCMYGVRIQDEARFNLPKARLTTTVSAGPPDRSASDLSFREVRLVH